MDCCMHYVAGKKYANCLSNLVLKSQNWLGCIWCDVRDQPAEVNLLTTYLLTPWRRVLLEKLTGLQLVKKFPAFHGTRRFITALTSVRHLSLPWASPIQSIYPHPISWRSILLLLLLLLLLFPGISAAGACCWPPISFKCRGHGRVELYLYTPSGPHWACNGITLLIILDA